MEITEKKIRKMDNKNVKTKNIGLKVKREHLNENMICTSFSIFPLSSIFLPSIVSFLFIFSYFNFFLWFVINGNEKEKTKDWFDQSIFVSFFLLIFTKTITPKHNVELIEKYLSVLLKKNFAPTAMRCPCASYKYLIWILS